MEFVSCIEERRIINLEADELVAHEPINELRPHRIERRWNFWPLDTSDARTHAAIARECCTQLFRELGCRHDQPFLPDWEQSLRFKLREPFVLALQWTEIQVSRFPLVEDVAPEYDVLRFLRVEDERFLRSTLLPFGAIDDGSKVLRVHLLLDALLELRWPRAPRLVDRLRLPECRLKIVEHDRCLLVDAQLATHLREEPIHRCDFAPIASTPKSCEQPLAELWIILTCFPYVRDPDAFQIDISRIRRPPFSSSFLGLLHRKTSIVLGFEFFRTKHVLLL